jgi:CRISPR-associated protein Cas5t
VISALEITVTSPVLSLRNPIYRGVQVGLPCPPPSTVGGFLASAVGGWRRTPLRTRFAFTFLAKGSGVDLETYHPLDARGTASIPTPQDREFLADATLKIWLTEDLDLWEKALRRPVWPLRFGRSQDLASARTNRVELHTGGGSQGYALVPEELTTAGTTMRLPTSISEDRSRTRWDAYRYAKAGSDHALTASGYATSDGQAVAFLPPTHPGLLGDLCLPRMRWTGYGPKAACGLRTGAASC